MAAGGVDGDTFVVDISTPIDAAVEGFAGSFESFVDVNTDEYKTTKIAFKLVNAISDGESDTFTMGSHKTDYLKVEDPIKRKYAAAGDSILDGSVDNHAQVTLENGGSYQKKDDFYDLSEDQTHKKYKRNRYFFMDPFELTIAQWCYVHEY